jgi:hypothetical protein
MRALDAFGFADLTRAVLHHVALTSCLEVGDPLKFKMRTPAEVLQTLERCWAIAPSGPRIVEDISALVRVLEKIVENEGACLLDEFYRSANASSPAVPAPTAASPLWRLSPFTSV